MKAGSRSQTLARIRRLDQFICLRFNRVRRRSAVLFWVAIGRLGDGIAWFALMAALPMVYGWQDLKLSLRMAAVGAFCIALYGVIKRRAARPRPYQAHQEVLPLSKALDPYAFPSGHTIHAVAFTVVVGSAHPALLWLLAPFAVLVALSRVVLGLHYPSDVLAGGALGGMIGWASLQF